jgi:transposase-like protein
MRTKNQQTIQFYADSLMARDGVNHYRAMKRLMRKYKLSAKKTVELYTRLQYNATP